MHLFCEAQVEHLFSIESDHSPIMLTTPMELKTGRRPFRFLKVWEEDQNSHDVVKQAWSGHTRGAWRLTNS